MLERNWLDSDIVVLAVLVIGLGVVRLLKHALVAHEVKHALVAHEVLARLADVKARQSSKIREIGEALITAGIVSLDAQAKVLGLARSTAWTILSAKHKSTGISTKIICRMLSSDRLPPLVRAKIVEYAEEKAAGIYGGSETQHRRFASKLRFNGPNEWATGMTA